MSIYRCEFCDLEKDNDKECVYILDNKDICQDCWNKIVEGLDETKRDSD